MDEDVAEALSRVTILHDVTAEIADVLRLAPVATFADAEGLRALIAHLQGRPTVPADWITHDPSQIRAIVDEFAARASEHAQTAASLAGEVGGEWRDIDPEALAVAADALGALQAMSPSWCPRVDATIEELSQRLALLQRSLEDFASIGSDAARIASSFGLSTFSDTDGNRQPFLTPNEVSALSIRRGSLSEKERREIELALSHSSNPQALVSNLVDAKKVSEPPPVDEPVTSNGMIGK